MTRWFQFSLKTTAWLMLLVGAFCGGLVAGRSLERRDLKGERDRVRVALEKSLYANDTRTVYVPMIESNSYRRNMGECLHEQLCRQIEETVPLKVVHNQDEAESILRVRLISDTKSVLMENPDDEPRQVQATWHASAEWIDSATGKELEEPVNVPLPPSLNPIDQSAYLFPELGQSMSSAELQVVQRLADQIVSMMEQPW